jgi:hypothetical protein
VIEVMTPSGHLSNINEIPPNDSFSPSNCKNMSLYQYFYFDFQDAIQSDQFVIINKR